MNPFIQVHINKLNQQLLTARAKGDDIRVSQIHHQLIDLYEQLELDRRTREIDQDHKKRPELDIHYLIERWRS